MTKLSRQNVGGIDYTMVGCTLTGVCASAASDYVKAVTLSDGDILSDGMSVVITFANGNTAGTAPASLTIYSSDQVNYYSDSGLTQPFTLAPSGCYDIEYTGTGNAYTYTSYPVVQIENVTAPLCDSCGKKTSGAVWDAGDTVLMLYSGNKFMVISGLTNSVTAGSRKAVTSGAVAAAIDSRFDLPTDAVLHYSFDEVPDYPDGTADVRLLNNNTYNVQSTGAQFKPFRSLTVSNSNGNAVLTASSDSSGSSGAYISGTFASNKIVKMKIKVTALNGTIDIGNGKGTGSIVIASYAATGTYEFCLDVTSSAEYPNLYITTRGTNESFIAEVLAIYVGNGSYSTPIIDNVNGQYSAANNGGIATNGVSGKGIKLLKNKSYINGDLPFKPHDQKIFTMSCWVKDWDTTTQCHIFDDWITQEVGNYFVAIMTTDTTLALGIDAPTDSGCIRFGCAKNNVNWDLLTQNPFLITVIFNGNDTKLYINGIEYPLFARTNQTLSDSIKARQIFQINRLYSSNAYTAGATIDDFQIFDRALSDTEVMALYLNKADTPKYFPIPTNEIKQNSLELATSGGVYSALHGANIASSVFTVTANWIANHTTDIRRLGNFLVCNIFVQVTTAQTLSSATKIATLSIKPSSNLRALGAVENTGVVIKAEINSQGDLTIAPFSGSVSVSGYIRFESIIFPIAAS